MSEKGKITRGRLGSLSLKKEGERQCFLFSKHLIICTRGSGGKLHLTKVCAPSQKSSTAFFARLCVFWWWQGIVDNIESIYVTAVNVKPYSKAVASTVKQRAKTSSKSLAEWSKFPGYCYKLLSLCVSMLSGMRWVSRNSKCVVLRWQNGVVSLIDCTLMEDPEGTDEECEC